MSQIFVVDVSTPNIISEDLLTLIQTIIEYKKQIQGVKFAQSDWLDEQPKQISDGIYKNNTDAKWAGKIISLYKSETGVSTKKPTRSKESDAAATVARQQPKEVATKDSTKKVWKGSDIAKMKPWEFEKLEKEIDLARQEGRINMNS